PKKKKEDGSQSTTNLALNQDQKLGKVTFWIVFMMDDQHLEEYFRLQLQLEHQQLLQSQGFTVLKLIGHGSFGNVFKVHHPELGEVAAKVINLENFDENEWNTAGRLSEDPPEKCPFVIRNIIANRFGENIVIILEYYNCGSLQDLIKSNVDIPIPTVRVIMRQILEGLSFIHSKGLVHRDIKAANILLHSPIGSGRIIAKIADFGEVKVKTQLDESSLLMSIRGTPPYMPPEIKLGNQNDPKYSSSLFDIWSLGILIYWMTTHSYPFNPNSDSSIIQFLANRVLTRPSSITDDLLWDLLVKMLCFDRIKRISASDALNHPFFTVLIPANLKPAIISANIQPIQIQQLDIVQPTIENPQTKGNIIRPGEEVEFSQDNNKVDNEEKIPCNQCGKQIPFSSAKC
ncbi:MAG: putative AGC family protein kinase, partial [Streblomastix strix]